ncbi:MAG TPA: hypothetical protein DET40_25580 [Lentisphaeria bacterium]|nr:MAG: hypothetical protein A2X45_04725 [Lentisphaerae bacterium GWF2_50_93]HCE46932.1 hypothetical protein [Lentisphaeria bacterium]
MKTRFLLSILLFMLFAGLQAQQKSDSPQARLQEFNQLLKTARDMGKDTSEAEKMQSKSRGAARSGRLDEAREFLDNAVKLLKAQTGNVQINKKLQPEKQLSASEKKPVFILPFTHHYAGPGGYYATAAEVRKTAAVFHELNIPGVLFFDGILVERLAREDPAIFKDINEWKLPLGYHGEETHGPYPVPCDLAVEAYDLKEAQGYNGQVSLNTGKTWDEAVQQVIDRYTHHLPWRIDEKTRMLERKEPATHDNSKLGGLALVQKTFGRDVSMMPSHALESAPEGYAFRKMSTFSFDQPAMPTAAHALRIFRIQDLEEKAMGIAGDKTGAFWFMGRLTCKGANERLGGECGGKIGGVRRVLESLDRSEPRILLMGFSHIDADDAAVSARYLNNDFFPANPGSCWVSPESLIKEFEGEKEDKFSLHDLEEISKYIISHWKSRPPDFIECRGLRISLCDAFEALARGMMRLGGAYSVNPENKFISISQMYGPLLEDGSSRLSSPVDLDGGGIFESARLLLSGIDKNTGDRFVPGSVKVSSSALDAVNELNPAEFLYAMAMSFSRADWKNSITVPPSNAFPPYADVLEQIFKPRTRQPLCYTKGQLWTVKTARLKSGQEKDVSSKSGALSVPGKLFFVFSSNLESPSGGAYREDITGADLYSATYDLSGNSISNLKKLVSNANGAEWFSALAPDSEFVIYNRTVPRGRGPAVNEIRYIVLKDGTDKLLQGNARFPSVSKDGRSLVFSMSGRDENRICVATLNRSGNSLSLGDISTVADKKQGGDKVEDPSFLPDAKKVVFHLKENKNSGAALGIISIDGSGFEKLTPNAGFGHASVSPDGKSIACTVSRNGKLAIISREGEGWGRPSEVNLSTEPADYVKYDDRFKGVARVAHSYVEWASDNMILLTSHGSDDSGKFSFSRIFLIELQPDRKAVSRIHDLSGAIEESSGRRQRDFCTSAGKLMLQSCEVP